MLVELDTRVQTTPETSFLPYVFGLTTVLAATMMALMAQPVLGRVPPHIIYILPVMAAAAYGGMRPGLTATGGSTLAIIFVFLPHRAPDLGSEMLLLLFLLDGFCISWLGKRMRTAIDLSRFVQNEVLEAHKNQERILSSISDAFGALDDQWRFVYANRNMASLAGTVPEALVGEEVWAVVPVFGAPAPMQALKQAVETGESTTFEMFVPHVGRWYENSVYPRENGVSLCSRDITTRLDAERVLRESEERLRLAPEASMVGTWTNDVRNGQLLWSPELRRLFGLSPQPFAGAEEALFEMICEDDRNPVKEVFARCKQDQVPFETEFRFSNPAGETRWMLIRGCGYADDAGRPMGMVGIGIDITIQKQNEEKLRHTQRLESLGVLAGGIAHDFNNLLLVIMGNASLASDLLPPHHPAKAPLEGVELATNRAASLTRQMLAYSGKGRVEVERLQVSTVIRDIERLIRSVISKNVELKVDLAADLPFIQADSGQMQQVIMNLVINAAESIPEGRQGTVRVRAYAQCLRENATETRPGEGPPPAGNYVTVEVEDDGIGMDDATRARIFEPFFTTKFLGRGLGLAAVLGIIRAHKGTLRVDSAPGKGTRFHVLLAAESATDPIERRETSSALDLRGEGLILIVDDESSIRQLAGTILETFGYSVLMADDGYSAVELLRRCANPPALVLLDLSMPGMSAQQTVEQIRFIRPDLPILLSSGYAESDVLRRFNNSPLLRFIHKPYTPAQLCQEVKAAIDEAAESSSCVAAVEQRLHHAAGTPPMSKFGVN